MNKAILLGRLTKDPEISTTVNGIVNCKFTLAISRNFKKDDGERETDFLPIIVWRQLAENCHKYLRKGSQCAVIGAIQTRNYEDKDGIKRYITEIVADSVEFVGSPSQSNGYSDDGAGIKKAAPTKKNIADLQPVDDDDLPF